MAEPGRPRPLVGVLAIQGDFAEHLDALQRLDICARAVRLPEQLAGLDGLIVPGGESTTLGKLARRYGFMDAIGDFAAAGRSIWGTCAGLIFLSSDCGRCQPILSLMEITVERNAFGSQIDSFEQDLTIPAIGDEPFPGVFIRAPLITGHSALVAVLAEIPAGVVAVEQENLLGTCFHPELTPDLRIHGHFLNKIAIER